jgi:hypothetical protein
MYGSTPAWLADDIVEVDLENAQVQFSSHGLAHLSAVGARNQGQFPTREPETGHPQKPARSTHPTR